MTDGVGRPLLLVERWGQHGAPSSYPACRLEAARWLARNSAATDRVASWHAGALG